MVSKMAELVKRKRSHAELLDLLQDVQARLGRIEQKLDELQVQTPDSPKIMNPAPARRRDGA